jgi:uncharacterized protein (DUF1015 family)
MNLLPFRALLPSLPPGSDATALFARSKMAYRPEDFRPYPGDPTYFLYRHTAAGEPGCTILIGLLDLAEWEQQRILPHEETLVAKENQQIRLTRQRGSSVKPVLLTYDDHTPHRALTAAFAQSPLPEELVVDIREPAAARRHQIYAVSEPARRQQLRQLLTEQLALAYVADGHHRLNTTYRMWREEPDGDRYRYLLTGLIAPQDLKIFSHYRVVQIDPTRAEEILRELTAFFRIRPAPVAALPQAVGCWSLFYRDRCYDLQWRQPASELDVARFNREVLPAVFDIHAVKTTPRMSYWEGDFAPEALIRQLPERADRMVFCPYPLPQADFFSTVKPGYLLPPKSTRFEPRMPNGLIVQGF